MKFLFLIKACLLILSSYAFADTAVDLSVNNYLSCALYSSGVKCWGENIGKVPVLSNPQSVAAGFKHACAIEDTGVKCWGSNQYGQINAPKMNGVKAVAAGFGHTCALDSQGVKCWGDNSQGQLKIPSLKNPRSLTVNYSRNCVLDDTGVKCWGERCSGSEFKCLDYPKVIKAQRLATGGLHTCVIDENKVKCWGASNLEQSIVPELYNPTEIFTGTFQTCAIDDSGLQCWGKETPAFTSKLPKFSNLSKVALGNSHMCALDDGVVKCWGDNSQGQLLSPEVLEAERLKKEAEIAKKEAEEARRKKDAYVRSKPVKMIPSGSLVTFNKDLLIGLNRSAIDIGVESKNISQCILVVQPDTRRERIIKTGRSYTILSVDSFEYENEFETTFILNGTMATMSCFAKSSETVTIGDVMDSLAGFGIKLDVLEIAEPADL